MKQTPSAIFSQFSQMNVMILGDVMIDAYVSGRVDRISPEAPVPVVTVMKRYNRLGGAANVALNVKSLGANPILCSVIGDDIRGDEFLELMNERNLNSEGLVRSRVRPTTTKFRIIGNNTQMLRVDEESTNSLSNDEYFGLSVKIIDVLDQNKIDAIIIEDYDKGCIDANILELITTEAQRRKIPISADPKRLNFHLYKKLTLFKPNFKELVEGLSAEVEINDFEKIAEISQQIIKERKIKYVMVTLSEHGLIICSSKEWFRLPAEVRQIADVSGAGDTVISTISLAIAAGLELKSAALLANIAGGLVCEHVGVVPVELISLIHEANRLMVF